MYNTFFYSEQEACFAEKAKREEQTKEDRRQPLLNSLVSKSINYGIMAIVQKDVQTDVPTNSPIGKGRRILDL